MRQLSVSVFMVIIKKHIFVIFFAFKNIVYRWTGSSKAEKMCVSANLVKDLDSVDSLS